MFTLRICYFAAICILLQAHPGFPQSSPCGVAPVIEDGPVKGEIDSESGFVVDLKELKDIMNREVIEALDHRHLNKEIP